MTAGFALAPEPVEARREANTDPAALALSAEQFTDKRTVELKIEAGSPVSVSSAASGRVTAVNCGPGQEWLSGSSPLSIDGQPRILLATAVPFWRDLDGGERGSDVLSLQAELGQLGYPVENTSRFDWQTQEALQSLYATVGVSKDIEGFRQDLFLWMPARAFSVGNCAIALGGTVSAGQPIASEPGSIASLQVNPVPTGLAEGARTVTVGGTTMTVGADGRVTSPDDLAAAGQEPSVALARQSGGTLPLSGSYQLAESIEVYAIPPSMIFGQHEGSGCISQGGVTHRVQIVASELGSTLVSFSPGTDTPTSVDQPTKSDKCV